MSCSVTPPPHHGLKLWAKMNPSSLGCLWQVFCHRNKKSNTFLIYSNHWLYF
jgi:hypothetical protein